MQKEWTAIEAEGMEEGMDSHRKRKEWKERNGRKGMERNGERNGQP